MRSLGDLDILAVWETAHRFHPVDQALALLMAVEPQRSRDELAALPLGRRDARLLSLRQALFGDSLSSRCACPHCHEAVEFELTCSALQAAAMESGVSEAVLEIEGHTLRLRPLNSYDVAAAAGAADVGMARHRLLDHCVIEARRGDEAINVDELPEKVRLAIAQAALAADPQAELLIELNCPACHRPWQALLDVVHILWSEIDARARRLLMEVHMLARAYGWHERDILAMNPIRRARYLQWVAS